MKIPTDRVILHIDINNCFASIEAACNPSLRGKAIAVAGSVEERRGIVLAKSEQAKRRGVKTGDTVREAAAKCPGLILCEPHYELYLKYSKAARKIYSDYTDRVEPFGIDEAWLDITGLYRNGEQANGEEIANEIRERVKRELGVTVSVGVSYNKIYAKLGSDLKKPDAVTVIKRADRERIVFPLDVGELLFVGNKTRERLNSRGVLTIGDLALANDAMLSCALGKNGLKLKRCALGNDLSPVTMDGCVQRVKSVSNSTTTPRDLYNEQDVKIVLYSLCENVAARLRDLKLKSSVVTVNVRNKTFECYSRQQHINSPTDDGKTLALVALKLYRESFYKCHGQPIRSLGVSAGELSPDLGFSQLNVFKDPSEEPRREHLNKALDSLRKRYGKGCVTRGIILSDRSLSKLSFSHDVKTLPGAF